MAQAAESGQRDEDQGETIRILMTGGKRLSALVTGLWTLARAEIHQVHSGKEAIQLLAVKPFQLVVIDEVLDDMSGVELARQVACQQPFVNCVLVDGGPHKRFHEKTEGLGVLMQLPSPPQMADTQKIVHHLSRIGHHGGAGLATGSMS
ncbi:MAG: hypothetical protein ACK5PS_17365 [Desulfopila sp.]